MSNRRVAPNRSAHPAYDELRVATRELRRQLAHALSIEYDWRYHDGPEWAARYWRAFGDLAVDLAESAAAPRYQRVLARSEWPSLSRAEADDVRTIFRGLVTVAHPAVDPAAADDARASLWPRILRAYRSGDRSALVAAWSETRALVRGPGLPDDVVALRVEHDRLRAAAEAADRRLAEMSRIFPFNVRGKLDDADWVRRQRLALSQVQAFTQAPAGGKAGHKRVS
ncbi:hypothetical protein [Salinisphaera sp. LB1]|uniref:hypothetical protein n=1 Tax=Salinisphaera sp. LB1 TaxID=2183911 RepID=UPI000D70580E|nr:hypothetical protein [Salinisphaera sp. LB1]AWN14414.1 hypothetical protein SALB1_0207 [Salinisphaera sp. LB1]